MFSQQLSSAILDICRSRKLSYEAASELCDLSARYFGSIVRGQTAPTVNTLEKLGLGLGRTPNDLLGVPADDELTYRAGMQVLFYRQHLFLGAGFTTFPVCPRCGSNMARKSPAFCDRCGQRLNRDGYDEASLPVGP